MLTVLVLVVLASQALAINYAIVTEKAAITDAIELYSFHRLKTVYPAAALHTLDVVGDLSLVDIVLVLAHSVGDGDDLVIGETAQKTAVQMEAYFTASHLKVGATDVWLLACSAGAGPADDEIYTTKLATAMKATWAGVTVHGAEGAAIADSVDNTPPIVIHTAGKGDVMEELQTVLIEIWDIQAAADTKLGTMGGRSLTDKAAAVYALPELTKFYKYYLEIGKAGGMLNGDWFAKRSADTFLETSSEMKSTRAARTPLAKMFANLNRLAPAAA